MFISGTRIMKMSQWRRAVENRCVFSARLKVLSDRFGDCSAPEANLTMDHKSGASFIFYKL